MNEDMRVLLESMAAENERLRERLDACEALLAETRRERDTVRSIVRVLAEHDDAWPDTLQWSTAQHNYLSHDVF